MDAVFSSGVRATWGLVSHSDWVDSACSAALGVVRAHAVAVDEHPGLPRLTIAVCSGPCQLVEVSTTAVRARVVLGAPIETSQQLLEHPLAELQCGVVINAPLHERYAQSGARHTQTPPPPATTVAT